MAAPAAIALQVPESVSLAVPSADSAAVTRQPPVPQEAAKHYVLKSSESLATVPSMKGNFFDPCSVIQQLNPVLGETGCIRNPQEVPMVVDFMKESNQLVSRCIILNVIKATDSPSTLAKFMDVGGWGVLNVWLGEAKKAQNTVLLMELLQVLEKLPVGIEALKQGNMGKLIKQISKQEPGDVQTLAGEILTKWMTVFKEAKSKSAEDRKNSIEESNAAKPSTKKKSKKKEGITSKSGKGDGGPPPESMQPPPGPLVALGRPKEKTLKRPRDLQVGQPPAEKKTKSSPAQADNKSSKAFVESEGFMNALQAAKLKDKKTKKVSKSSKLARSNSTSSASGDSAPSQEKQDPTSSVPEPSVESMEVSDEVESKKKKKVSWATEEKLTKIHYFQLDESERVNVNRRTSFLDAAQKEKMREREALESGLMFSRDRLIEMIPWHRPPLLEVQGELVVRGLESKEKDIQAEREGKVLAQLFLSKASVQPSPTEPDPEPDMVETEPKLIPLLEPNSAGGSQNQPPAFGSPPTMPSNGGPGSGPIPPGSPLPSPATTINQAQSLINYFNAHGPNAGGLPGPGGPRGGGAGRGPPPNNSVPGGSSYQGSEGNFYPQGQGYPPGGEGGGPPMGPPPGHWRSSEGGAYFEEGHFRGDPGMRRGHGYMPAPMRGGGGGRGRGFWRRGTGQICKHFLTHGCKLGSKCRFMHCTPEELANKMATNEPGFGRRPPPPPAPLSRVREEGRFGGPDRQLHNGADTYNNNLGKPSPPQSGGSPPTAPHHSTGPGHGGNHGHPPNMAAGESAHHIKRE